MKRAISKICLALLMAALAALCMCSVAFADAISESDDGTMSIVGDDSAFGLSGCERLQTGSNKSDGDTDYGYVYALGLGAKDRMVVLATDSKIIVHIPAAMAQEAGMNLESNADLAAFEELLTNLDEKLANGGKKLSEMSVPFVYTTDDTYVDGDVTYSFGVEIGEDYYYACVKVANAETSRGITRFCICGKVLSADQVESASGNNFIASAQKFLTKLDWRPLWVSLKTSFVALVIIFILGLVAAWRTMHVQSRWKSVLDTIFTIPMVLPPTVCGFILLLIFGKATGFGRWLIAHGIDLVFTWPAAVIAAVVVGFPLMYRTVLGAFEALDVNMMDAARTLGWSETRIFRTLMLPLAWPSIAAGTVLGFARAMGEFGATLFFAGNYAGVTQTMPIAIYFSWMAGSTDVAIFWAVVVIIISFLIIMIINLYSMHVQKFRRNNASGIDEEMGNDLEDVPMAFEEAVGGEGGN